MPDNTARARKAVLVWLAALIALPGVTVYGDGLAPFSAEARLTRAKVSPGQSVVISVSVSVPPQHHLYKKECSLEVTAPEGFAAEPLSLPPGRKYRDEILGEELEIYAGSVTIEREVRVGEGVAPGEYELVATLAVQGCKKDVCFPPVSDSYKLKVEVVPGEGGSTAPAVSSASRPPDSGSATTASGGGFDFSNALEQKGLLLTLLACFGFGVATAFTGCIYPVVPIILAVIGVKKSQSKWRGFALSVVYVLGMSVTYSVLGLMSSYLTRPIGIVFQYKPVMVAMGLLFVALALSMFGAFTIQLPAALREKVMKSPHGGAGGALVLGLVSGLVVSPCVGPVVIGILAWVALSGDPLRGFLALTFFAWGMGLPLIAFGTFAGLIQSRPQPGPWLDTVKHAIGALILLPAFYFMKQGLPEVILYPLTAAGLITLGVFAGGFEALPADSGILKKLRKAFGLFAFAAGVCLLASMFLGARAGPGAVKTGAAGGSEAINWRSDSAAALAEAGAEGRPVLVDFTAEWCLTCKKMEKSTFVDADVVAESRRFTAIRIDLTSDSEYSRSLADKFGVGNPPAVLLLASGQLEEPAFRSFGYTGSKELLEEMRKLR